LVPTTSGLDAVLIDVVQLAAIMREVSSLQDKTLIKKRMRAGLDRVNCALDKSRTVYHHEKFLGKTT
jgi:hypothetical protein